MEAKHVSYLIAREMELGATFEEAEYLVNNTLVGQAAKVHDALDELLQVFKEALEELRRN